MSYHARVPGIWLFKGWALKVWGAFPYILEGFSVQKDPEARPSSLQDFRDKSFIPPASKNAQIARQLFSEILLKRYGFSPQFCFVEDMKSVYLKPLDTDKVVTASKNLLSGELVCPFPQWTWDDLDYLVFEDITLKTFALCLSDADPAVLKFVEHLGKSSKNQGRRASGQGKDGSKPLET